MDAAYPLVDLVGPFNDLEQKFAPTQVYVRGDLRLLASGPRLAIVGSRKASAAGRESARALAERCARSGVTVVSGLAEGIDAAAHLGAIRAGGRTLAVLGTPLDRYYPASNRALQDEIGRDHLLVSQFGSGASIQRGNFPRRNKLMVLLSHALLVVEAGENSGTRDQVWSAIRVGTPVLISRRLYDARDVRWVASAVEYGADLIEGPDDLAEAMLDFAGHVRDG